MEGGQGIEHHPVGIQRNVLGDLSGVGRQVALTQHHSLWRAETAGGEQDNAGIVPGGRRKKPRRYSRRRRRKQLVRQAHLLPHILKIGHRGDRLQRIDEVVQLTLFDKFVRRQDPFDAGQLACRLQVPNPGGEVEHGRHAAKGVQGEKGHHHAGTGGKHDAHPLPLLGHPGDFAPQSKGGPNEVGIGEGIAVLVFQDQLLRAELGSRVQQRLENRAVGQVRIQRLRQWVSSPPMRRRWRLA